MSKFSRRQRTRKRKKTQTRRRLHPAALAEYEKQHREMVSRLGLENTTHVFRHHDDWCGVFKGQDCNCDPYEFVLPPHNAPR